MERDRQRKSYLSPESIIPVLGFVFFVLLMAGGYYYNLTFVQLGLVEFGRTDLNLDRAQIGGLMALLALLTCGFALAAGWLLDRRRWSENLVLKLRLIFLVLALQTLLTYSVSAVESAAGFTAWLAACSIVLGSGVPLTFSLAVDLVPSRLRGLAGGLITGMAYLAANLVPASWTMAEFARPLLVLMPLGTAGLGAAALLPNPVVRQLAIQHQIPEYGEGRYHRKPDGSLLALVLLMFGVFFTDSLGFLRMLDTPRFMAGAWQSTSLQVKLLIGLVHLAAAVVGGVLYRNLNVKELFYWIYGIFALTHLMNSLHIRLSSNLAPLAMTMLYAVAVSLYTVVNFALWADLSTPRNIGRNTALGVALSGWTATFISTALAFWMQDAGITLERHINITDSVAMLFFLALILLPLISTRSTGESP